MDIVGEADSAESLLTSTVLDARRQPAQNVVRRLRSHRQELHALQIASLFDHFCDNFRVFRTRHHVLLKRSLHQGLLGGLYLLHHQRV